MFKVGVCLALTLALALVGATVQSASQPGALRLEPCKRDGISPPAKCGTYTVFENRDAKTGRTLDLNVILLQATEPDLSADPMVYLAGGPGEAATSMALTFDRDDMRRTRDILLVDQRGTGGSNGLYCRLESTAPLQAFMPMMDPNRINACRQQLEQQADLRYYLTTHAMDDLDDLRGALGYERINLHGDSYGTRAALVYLRRNGEHVRSVTLTATDSLGYFSPSRVAPDAEASLRSVLRQCGADRACRAAFPAIEEDYQRTVRRIQERPVRLRITDPRNGDPVDVSLRAADFAEALRAMLYKPETTRHIPLFLHQAAIAGDYRPFAEFQLKRNQAIANAIALGMYFATTCSEDIAGVDAESVYVAGRGTFLADHRARPHIEACKSWPLGQLPKDFRTDVKSSVPVLVIAGENDPATPPASARSAAARLTNAKVIIVPQGGHSFDGLIGQECVKGLAARFLETASVQALDDTCAASMHRRPFVLSLQGGESNKH
jgi:pimeloyl-ACP methyl ester carboxylesterase